MAQDCSYSYKGKTYSTDRLLRQLVTELPSRSQQESVDFLKDYLGMEESEIQTVKGLIDNKSLGRFKADGKILLSDLATPDVAFHEAFHRVWRMYLNPTERLAAIKELKLRKNIDKVLESYREVYPKLSENDLLEEVLADEFADYTLNTNYKVETPIKSLFQRLVNFLKKLLGIKAPQIQMIYDKILAKTYKGKPKTAKQYFKDADKLLVSGVEFTIEQKNELIAVLTQRFVKAMLDINGDIDLFLAKESTGIKKLLEENVIPSLGNDLLDISEEEFGHLVDALYEDTDKVLSKGGKLSESIFMNGVIQNLKLIGLEIKDLEEEDESDGALDKTDQKTREFSASIEVDPKSKMGKKIKLLLSSLVDTTENTPALKLDKPLSWTKGFVQIATRMKGIPTQVFMQELQNTGLPYVNNLIDLLNKDTVFKDKFISTMNMTENKFMKMKFDKGDIYFFDANSGTKREKILNEWKNGLTKKVENWDEWRTKIEQFKNNPTKTTNEQILEHFGFEVNNNIENLQSDLRTLVNQVSKYTGEKPDSKSLFKTLGIDGYMNQLADKQSAYEDTTDLMVLLGGKKLYTLGLNTQQSLAINSIKYAQSKFTPEMTQTEKINLIRLFSPFQVCEFNVTELEDGSYIVHNEWLRKILNGEQLNLVIPYMAETEEGQAVEVAKLDEPDLMSMHVNGALQGMNMSLKHGDRSTFFAYTFGNKPIYKETTVGKTIEHLVNNIKEQIDLEVKFARNMKARNIPVQYISGILNKKTGEYEIIGAFTQDILGKDEFKRLVDGGELTDLSQIRSFVNDRFKEYQKDVADYGLLEEYKQSIYEDGKKKGDLTHLKGINNKLKNDYGSIELLLATAFVNEVSNHIFETRFFSGDVRSFKNGTDGFKRLVPQSSTGNLSVNSEETHQFVREALNQDFEIINPVTGKAEVVNPSKNIGLGKDKYFRGASLAERDNFKSYLLEPAFTPSGKPVISKLTGLHESKLFMLFEHGFIKDFPEKSLEELKKSYAEKFKMYEDKYAGVNENDGISYMILPAFKNFMIRQGNWNDGMELVYQTEMKIASLTNTDDIANIEITIKGHTFKPFEVKSQKVGDKVYDGWKNRIINGKHVKLDALHTLKTQFAGYSTPEEYYEEMKGQVQYLFNTVFKTSQHLLLPSAILGSNLQLMNFSMLTNGIDITHMGSANKVGGVDPKLATQNIINDPNDIRNNRKYLSDINKRGLDFYDENGYFNHEALTENLDVLTYLADWEQLKDQVNIGNKVKEEIKGSTQSLKILLSNLIVNNKPRFEGAQELVDKYKQVIKEMVKDNHDNLLKRIGYNLDTSEFDSLDKLKQSVLGSSQMQNAPDNIKNSVENFFNDPELGLEAVPLKNKIENVLYSLITNGIISFDRAGSSYPQAAITGYEKLGSRKFNEDGTQTTSQDTLKFYEPIFNEEGDVIEVKPAEVIMPLPDYWIKPLLRWAKTNNLAKAIEKLNADILVRPELYQFKGLRIPNQQLSSNDFFQVKRFNIPTMQSYMIIPSEMVIKTGGDFDIDKINIYWAEDTELELFGDLTDEEILDNYDKYVASKEGTDEEIITFEQYYDKHKNTVGLDRTLLNYERELLLHPRNIHHLLMPLTDEIWVQDVYQELLDKKIIQKPGSSFFSAMLPSTNVRNSTIFVKGKYGVGPVALGITNSATNQADSLSLSKNFSDQSGDVRPTKLLFEGMGENYFLDNYTDNEGTVISEILSQLLTTQVDNVKNPTAVLMNINMQTLGVVLYLVRRGMNPKSIVYFINQPLIKQYLLAQKQNESQLNKNANDEQSKKKLIEKILKKNGYKVTSLPDVYEVKQDQDQFLVTDKDMVKSAVEQNFDQKQLSYLSYFLDLVDQSRAFSDFQSTQNSDTKGLKDKQSLDESLLQRYRVSLSQIIDPFDVNRLDQEGVISPFYEYGRQKYQIFNDFYALQQSVFGQLLTDFKDKAATVASSNDKDRVRQTIENDFILFLIHNFLFTKEDFNRLTKDKSVAKRVLELKTKIPQNAVLKAFFPMLGNSVDLTDSKKIDNLRLFEKELNGLDSNDLRLSLEEIADVDMDLYTDIVKLLMFQSGLNIGPFNYRQVIPVGLEKNRNEFNEYQYVYQDMLSQAIKQMNSKVTSLPAAQNIFSRFKTLFAANNPQFLKKNFKHSEYPYDLARTWNRENKRFVLNTKDNKEQQTQLGNAYMKQYFVELIELKPAEVKPQNPVKQPVPNETEDLPYTDYEEVTNTNKVPVDNSIKLTLPEGDRNDLAKYELFPGVFANEGQRQAIDLLTEFLSSNKQEFTLIGRGGTGKTTIIKKVLDNARGTVGGITVAHKAKKVLGRSIGKEKVKTVASALAIKLDESTGHFVPDAFARQQGRVPIKFMDIIIVDEASMISPGIYKEIMTLKSKGAKVIFMGDNAQLPPIGESEDSPVFKSKDQFTLKEKMRQAKTSPIINVGSIIAENIESSNVKVTALKESDRVSSYDEVSGSSTVFTNSEDNALADLVSDFKAGLGNPDFVKAVTFNNEKHSAAQSVKNLNSKIRDRLWGSNSKNQFNVGELLTAYATFAPNSNMREDEILIHNSDDFVVSGISTSREKGSVRAFSQKNGEREFRYEYDLTFLQLTDSDGKIVERVTPVVSESSKKQFEDDMAELWKNDKQLAFVLQSKFANLQYGYAITSHKAQGSTYTNTYVFEDNILGPSNAGDAITKNKSLYVAVSRPTTKLVMISNQNRDSVLSKPEGEKQSVTPSSFINYSGAAEGSDQYWETIGKQFGIGKQVNFVPSDLSSLTREQLDEVEQAYQKARTDIGRPSLDSGTYPGKLVRRDYLQAKAADAVFAIGTIVNPGMLGKKYTNKAKTQIVDGGTGYGVQMAINLGKPVFVFDQSKDQWFKWEYNKDLMGNNVGGIFVKTDTPTLTQKFAGIGTRELTSTGKSAIQDVYNKTFGQQNQVISDPNVRLVEQTIANNTQEMSKAGEVKPTELQQEILNNWSTFFPQYSWMNDQQKLVTAKLVEEGKITLTCSL